MRKTVLLFSVLLLSLQLLTAQSYGRIFQPGSEGPVFDYSIVQGEPKEYYDAGGPDKGMRNNYAYTMLQLKPTNANSHITIVFEEMELDSFDEMRIYSGIVVLNNEMDEDGEYRYGWPKGLTPTFQTKGTPAKQKFAVSSTAPDGALSVAFFCASAMKGWKGMIYCVKNGDPEPLPDDETPANIVLKMTDDLGVDEDGYEIDEATVQMHLGAQKEGTAIQIDWGSGEKIDYTIGSKEPVSISQTIDKGAVVKIYGELTLLDITNNPFVEAHFDKNDALKVLRLAQNKISRLNLDKLTNLRELWITDNKLTSIDISHLANLEEFYGGWNAYTELRTAMNPKLTVLTCYNTSITALDLSQNQLLEILTAGGNNYTTPLDLSHTPALKSLDLEGASLTSIDVTMLPNLKKLNLQSNKLSTLDIASNKALRYLDLRGNPFDACTLNDICYLLPKATEADEAKLFINKTTGGATAHTAMLKEKAWKSDIEGDGTGCNTIRLLCLPAQHGTFATLVEGKAVASWTPIQKGADVTISATPEDKYMLKKIVVEGKEITGNTFKAEQYAMVEVLFVLIDAIDDARREGVAVRCAETSLYVEGLEAEAPYQVYDAKGVLLVEGRADAQGTAEVTMERGAGLWLIRQGTTTVKVIR